MLKKSINYNQFLYEFERFDRQDTFSEKAMEMIYSQLSEHSYDVDLDVIELCSIYSEMDMEEYIKDYSNDMLIGITEEHCVLIMHC